MCVKILWLHPKLVKLLWLMQEYRSDLNIRPIWAITINHSTRDQQDQLSDTSELYIHHKILFLVWRKCGYTKSRQPAFFEWTQKPYDQEHTNMSYQIISIVHILSQNLGLDLTFTLWEFRAVTPDILVKKMWFSAKIWQIFN